MSQDLQQTQQDDLLSRVGHMTRLLHDSLRGLGLDKLLERAAEDIPDARDRLDYVAKMSEQAAQRVLNATDIAIPLQEQLDSEAKKISLQLQSLQLQPASSEQMQQMTAQMLQYLALASENSVQTKSHLMDIMMAQDFQDLTGQVIKKVTALAQNLEQQLVQLLIDYSPNEVKKETADGLLNGPQIKPEGKTDVVANQSQVDDLLDSLGF
ncbi:MULTISPECIES: protein phosphatase CheZ [unclassified Undibacterium]|uniref:protein phosphatase CheZ n=1 Tax=unclassified Undibacterium TaxID=2630295 RepID=UPI002AC9681D|nr:MULTISPECIES: protein phosphatase CheZ [unclassified Undibacterium]MEB0138748.1 protein phosphatase CheZ [Undibacterium sp. CCC2.1]MEB0171549.1 protein phosphatase CheZ [Undibacterium sp. CCC1.1]MEB0175380.1 protein phosphatase CheZ [Undibacterium sp. CCC3.4]MEB0214749.1 protein phosphatase CheZ [Undibacterium sp. 5I2]WPX43293.1 protein phosphatase CheZ [Undibacterium sp. CCC3.4]